MDLVLSFLQFCEMFCVLVSNLHVGRSKTMFRFIISFCFAAQDPWIIGKTSVQVSENIEPYLQLRTILISLLFCIA